MLLLLLRDILLNVQTAVGDDMNDDARPLPGTCVCVCVCNGGV